MNLKELKNNLPPEHQTAKEEMNLAEYPFTLLSRRAPKGIKTIKFSDWVTINGEKRPLKWIVTGSDEFGLPVGGDQDVYISIMEVWKEHRFKDRVIPIGSIYKMLKRMGLPDNKQNYIRFKQSLDRLTGVYIKTENAFWDREGEHYISHRGFHIFDEYSLLERYRQTDNSMPLPFGYVKAGEFFYQSVKRGYLKEIDLKFYLALSTPLAKRLYRYLDKKRYKTDVFSVELYKFAGKIGLMAGTSRRYYPNDFKNMLNPALDQLKTKGFLKSYSYQKTADGKGLKIVFLFSHLPVKIMRPTQEDGQADLLVEDILAVCKDEHSTAFYKKVAQLLPENIVRRAISEVKGSALQGEVKTTAGKLFTHIIKKYARDFGIEL